MNILPHSFYDRDTVQVAKDLLGKVIIRTLPEGVVTAIITETEAYRSDDPACHAYKGKTPRNAALFGPVGHTYVYCCYGIHHCVNLVARDTEHFPSGGVLIRAVILVKGKKIVEKYTGKKMAHIKGPGNVTKALAINRDNIGIDSTKQGSEIILTQGAALKSSDIVMSKRIGISQAKDKLWRFLIPDGYCVQGLK